ncbi:hypothetical protein GALMADRAFT_161792 [Galerina marginata CBS 339.88]|uniref:Uncharacterized protein n=1 Tax=Galerina marginata (strain CBS 339.88) TaxID=685588 RepID=A0A067S7Z9_GALM3|nr:hypothetical protein GALMADRAFT_161792 [Galerina marginata CBS 339.88]
MSTTSPLNFILPEELARDQRWHLSTLELESKMFSILDTYLQPASGVSALTAAQKITQLYPTDPATQKPGTHDPLAFTFLKLLGAVLVDNVESHGIIINDNSDEQKESRLRDINFQGFASRLTAAGVWDLSRLEVYRLRDVLEEDPDYYIAGFNNLGAHLDACIRPAEVWVTLCADVIFRFCRSNGQGADRDDMHGGTYWTGKRGFSMERWEFWKVQLDRIAVNQEASAETRDIAKDLKKKMIAAEDSA